MEKLVAAVVLLSFGLALFVLFYLMLPWPVAAVVATVLTALAWKEGAYREPS